MGGSALLSMENFDKKSNLEKNGEKYSNCKVKFLRVRHLGKDVSIISIISYSGKGGKV
jgi:hypothetical protein